MLKNYELFDAPHVAIVTTEANLGVYGAVDCGLFVQTFLLAAESLAVAAVPRPPLPDMRRSSESTLRCPLSGSCCWASHLAIPTRLIRPTATAPIAKRATSWSHGSIADAGESGRDDGDPASQTTPERMESGYVDATQTITNGQGGLRDGAAQGVGFATARALARSGVTVRSPAPRFTQHALNSSSQFRATKCRQLRCDNRHLQRDGPAED